MIRMQDAATLAFTKLRTRKVRLIITIVVSGVLFSGLAGASIVARGVIGSVADFSKEGLGDRYIAQAFSQSTGIAFDDPDLMDRSLAIYKDTITRKKAEAKRLGIAYDAASDPSPVSEYDIPGGGKQRNLDFAHPAAQQAYAERITERPPVGEKEFTAALDGYDVEGRYKSRQLPFELNGAQLQVLKDGKESFGQSVNNKGPASGTDSFVTSWMAMSSPLLKPFILPGQHLALGDDGSIPIIVPFSAAEQLLKLKSLPASAPPAERLTRVQEVRKRAKDVMFAVCYRNNTSAEQVSQAVNTQQELERNKNNKEYQKPEFMYGVPTEPCGAVPVVRDVRSKETKQLAEKQRQFDELFGAVPAAQTTWRFRVVGVVPDPNYSVATGVEQIIRSLVTSSLGTGWYAPAEVIAKNPTLNELFNSTAPFGSFATYYAEFNTAAAARKFIDSESCRPSFEQATSSNDPFAECIAKGKPFETAPFGSNSLALESAKRAFGKIFGIAALVIACIACIIMMGTVGRMIADSRRETAVFRAIGAKKLDIAQVYLLYTVMLALLISVVAVVVGIILGVVADAYYGEEVTVQALVAYNAQDLNKSFHLYGFYARDMLYLFGLALLAGLLSSVIPLIRNLRRNPIRDMRDDT